MVSATGGGRFRIGTRGKATQTPLRFANRDAGWSLAFSGRLRKDRADGIPNGLAYLLGRGTPTLKVESRPADDRPGARKDVRNVKDAPLVEQDPVAGADEDVVCRTDDRAAAQPPQGQVVQDAPQGTGRENVPLDVVDLAGIHEIDIALLGGELSARGVDIRSEHRGPLLHQSRRELTADLAEALDNDGAARPIDLAIHMFERGRHAPKHPRTRRLGDLPRAVVPGGRGPARLRGDPGELFSGSPDVRSGVDPAPQAFENSPQVPVGPLEVEVLPVEDHDLGSTDRKVSECAFVGYRPGETQAVQKGLPLIAVGPTPDAAERRTPRGVVDAQERLETRGPVRDRVDLLEPAPGHRIENVYCHMRFQRWIGKIVSLTYAEIPMKGTTTVGKSPWTRASNAEMIRNHSIQDAAGKPARSVRALALILALAWVGGCSSGPKKAEGLPFDEALSIAKRERARTGPMGPLLVGLDAEVRNWTGLNLAADTDQRRNQARILEQSLRHQAELRHKDLVGEMVSDSAYNRMVAAVVLGFTPDHLPNRIHDNALSALVGALEDPSEDVQSNALLGLAILAHSDTPPRPVAEQMLHSANPKSRGNAAMCLRKIIDAGAVVDNAGVTARSGLLDPEPNVRAQCAMLIAQAIDTESIDSLGLLLLDDTPLVALAAARALAYIGSREPTEKGKCARLMAEALDEVEDFVRSGILQTLRHLSGRNHGKKSEDWIEWANRLP